MVAGGGAQTRTFSISQVAINGGSNCLTQIGAIEEQSCNTDACPANVAPEPEPDPEPLPAGTITATLALPNDAVTDPDFETDFAADMALLLNVTVERISINSITSEPVEVSITAVALNATQTIAAVDAITAAASADEDASVATIKSNVNFPINIANIAEGSTNRAEFEVGFRDTMALELGNGGVFDAEDIMIDTITDASDVGGRRMQSKELHVLSLLRRLQTDTVDVAWHVEAPEAVMEDVANLVATAATSTSDITVTVDGLGTLTAAEIEAPTVEVAGAVVDFNVALSDDGTALDPDVLVETFSAPVALPSVGATSVGAVSTPEVSTFVSSSSISAGGDDSALSSAKSDDSGEDFYVFDGTDLAMALAGGVGVGVVVMLCMCTIQQYRRKRAQKLASEITQEPNGSGIPPNMPMRSLEAMAAFQAADDELVIDKTVNPLDKSLDVPLDIVTIKKALHSHFAADASLTQAEKEENFHIIEEETDYNALLYIYQEECQDQQATINKDEELQKQSSSTIWEKVRVAKTSIAAARYIARPPPPLPPTMRLVWQKITGGSDVALPSDIARWWHMHESQPPVAGVADAMSALLTEAFHDDDQVSYTEFEVLVEEMVALDWEEVFDEVAGSYFCHRVTRETVWKRPTPNAWIAGLYMADPQNGTQSILKTEPDPRSTVKKALPNLSLLPAAELPVLRRSTRTAPDLSLLSAAVEPPVLRRPSRALSVAGHGGGLTVEVPNTMVAAPVPVPAAMLDAAAGSTLELRYECPLHQQYSPLMYTVYIHSLKWITITGQLN